MPAKIAGISATFPLHPIPLSFFVFHPKEFYIETL
jgi:hypothetical protein